MLPGQVYFLIAGQRLRRKAAHCAAELVRVLAEQRLRDDENVVAALAQRGQPEVHDVQAVVEVLAEFAGLDHLLEVAIGRGDDADVALLRLAVADAEDDALLDRAQQLHLKLRRQLADLVEEQGAAVGLLELARRGSRSRPVKAPFTWPNISLSIRFSGDRPAIDGDERAVARGCCDGESRARSAPCRCRFRR